MGGNKKFMVLTVLWHLKSSLKTFLAKINKYAEKLDELRAYPARGFKYIDLKESVFKNAKNFYDGWERTVNGFKNGI